MAPPASPPPLTPQTSNSPSSSTTSPPNNVTLPLRLQLQRSKSSSTESTNATKPPPTWSPAQESRLLHCQTELHSAQKRWSASQELWIEEVEHLSEMKKKHLKAVKKLDQERDVRAKKVVGVWKRRTWKRGSRSGVVTPVTEPVTRAGSEDEGEGEEGDEDGNVDDEDGGRKMGLIRRRSEGVTVDLPPPSPRRPLIAVTLRKLSVPGIKRRSTAPEGEGFDGRGE